MTPKEELNPRLMIIIIKKSLSSEKTPISWGWFNYSQKGITRLLIQVSMVERGSGYKLLLIENYVVVDCS
jgi:hypothetical protein